MKNEETQQKEYLYLLNDAGVQEDVPDDVIRLNWSSSDFMVRDR